MSDFMSEKIISYSSADDFQTCQRLYEFKHVLGLALPDTQAMRFGTVMDYAYDMYYQTRSVEAAIAVIEERWPGDLTEDKGRTKARAVKVMKMYAEKWADDGIEVIVPAHRETRLVPIPGTEYRLALRLDKLVKWAQQYRVMEHKTTSTLTAYTINRFDPNLQLKLYIWAARRLNLPSADSIAGAIVDITCINTSKIGFARDLVQLTKAQEEETERTLVAICRDIESRSAQHFYVPNWGACTQYGECFYRRICKHSPELRESIIRKDYGKGDEKDESDVAAQ